MSLVTLGCTRNEVDSEELAGRLAAGGWELVDAPEDADVAVINTCGFIAEAKKDSIDTVLEASDLKSSGGRTKAVVAVGCLAQRYGQELADELPEADAVLGFDSYADMSAHLTTILAGGHVPSHTPGDRRKLLPLTPTARQGQADGVAIPGHGPAPVEGTSPRAGDDELATLAPASGPTVLRTRLDNRPWAPLKIASGCDRRCAFCAIPMFRGAFLSRPLADVVTEARWLVGQGVKEVLLVSENSTSYGKDLGDLGLLEKLLVELSEIEGLERIRVSYLQPAEIRPTLLSAMAHTPKVAQYYDVSFQHSSEPLLRRMRRFGSTQSFLELIARIRKNAPTAGIRCNVIVGFPGETEADIAELTDFLTQANLDVVGVFGYSDEDHTEGEALEPKIAEDVIAYRVQQLTALVEELSAQRAEDRIGEVVTVLLEELDEDGQLLGRTEFQGPDVDGMTIVTGARDVQLGDLIEARIVAAEGIDLVAEAL